MSKPLPPDPSGKVDKETELGTLIVVLLKARNLYDKHSFRKSDVFAQATLNGAQKRTAVDIKGGQHPEWDGEVRFSVMKNASAKYRKLEVACYSQEPRSEDLMGKGVVDITQTLQTGEFDDWVHLEIDGVQRGEIYLEMTYYANAPPLVPTSAPNKFLSAVQNQGDGLVRRPSKLSPAERLSRLPPGRPQNHFPTSTLVQPTPAADFHSLPHRSNGQYDQQKTASDVQPNAMHTSLTPARVPDSLAAGRLTNFSNSGSSDFLRGRATEQQGQPLPTILRPGPHNSSPPSTSSGPRPIPRSQQNEHSHSRNPSSSPPSNGPYVSPKNPYINLPSGSPSNPYLGGRNPVPNPYIGSGSRAASNSTVYSPYSGHSTPPDGQSVTWRQSSIPLARNSQEQFAFPAQLPPDHQQSSYWHNQHNSTTTSAGGDTYLQARYQTPLPLPPEATSGSQSARSSPPQTATPLPSGAHFEALKLAEDEAKRRRVQEMKDLELAMELDRQLNMDQSRSSGGDAAATANSRMPGGW